MRYLLVIGVLLVGVIPVLGLPTISIQPIDQVAKPGDTVSFGFSVPRGSVVTFQWQFEGEDLSDETDLSLVLTNVDSSMVGAYTVVVTDASGSITSDVAILKLWRPVNPPFDPGFSVNMNEGQFEGDWQGEGILETANSPNGPWSEIPSSDNRFTGPPPETGVYYRIKNPHPRPTHVYLPLNYDPSVPLPLVILLHGYTGSGVGTEAWMRFQPLADSREFIYCYPGGIEESSPQGRTFWNATDACCNFFDSQVDDVAYLTSLIEEVSRNWNVDPNRVHILGHSNGGFMAYRMAGERASMIASIASFAGATGFDPENFPTPSEPVSILQLHGTADEVISYNSGDGIRGIPYPGAMETIGIWAAYNGCENPETETSFSMDLVANVPGLDTKVTSYSLYPPGGAVELWTIEGGTHSPPLTYIDDTSQFAESIVDWLLAHPKPQQ